MVRSCEGQFRFHNVVVADSHTISQQTILQTLAQLSEVYGKLNFYKVDVDEHAQLTQMAGARIYPTIIVYRGGNKVNKPRFTLRGRL